MEPDRIVDVETGTDLSLTGLIEHLSRSRIVFIGENHEHRKQHENQLKIIRALHHRWSDLVVGLELFPRAEQALLDEWTSGQLETKEFITRVLGRVINMGAFRVYLPLLLWARDNRVKILALNAPRNITAKIARGGLAAVSEEDRKWIAKEIVQGPRAYKLSVRRAFERHAAVMDPDRFFTAQLVWDETMAETLADFLKSPEGRDRPMVVICGNNHVYQSHGVPDRLARRIRIDQTVVYCPLSMDDLVIWPGDADYVWVTAPEPPRKRVRLGVRMAEPEPGRIIIESVEPGSEAEHIGLMAGDRLISLDGQSIDSMMDMHQAAIEGGVEATHTLEIERDGKRASYNFRFRETVE